MVLLSSYKKCCSLVTKNVAVYLAFILVYINSWKILQHNKLFFHLYGPQMFSVSEIIACEIDDSAFLVVTLKLLFMQPHGICQTLCASSCPLSVHPSQKVLQSQ